MHVSNSTITRYLSGITVTIHNSNVKQLHAYPMSTENICHQQETEQVRYCTKQKATCYFPPALVMHRKHSFPETTLTCICWWHKEAGYMTCKLWAVQQLCIAEAFSLNSNYTSWMEELKTNKELENMHLTWKCQRQVQCWPSVLCTELFWRAILYKHWRSSSLSALTSFCSLLNPTGVSSFGPQKNRKDWFLQILHHHPCLW